MSLHVCGSAIVVSIALLMYTGWKVHAADVAPAGETPRRLFDPKDLGQGKKQAEFEQPKPGVGAVQSLIIVADDFVTDIYHNGKVVPAERRKLIAEIFGAQIERVELTIRPGDWVVFNVVNNKLRWKGAYYFAVAGKGDPNGPTTLVTETRSGHWSACDDLTQAPQFIANADFLHQRKAQPVRRKWSDGDKTIQKQSPGFNGEPIWGDEASRSTWIKYVAPRPAK
jgi:hypothetical protein